VAWLLIALTFLWLSFDFFLDFFDLPQDFLPLQFIESFRQSLSKLAQFFSEYKVLTVRIAGHEFASVELLALNCKVAPRPTSCRAKCAC
jgi:hypothetical protein